MSSVLLRRVPGWSVVHRLWAGTKLLSAVAISLLLLMLPKWPVMAVVAVFLAITMLLARIPPSALPRPPWWVWAALVAGSVPNAVVSSTALLNYLQLVLFGALLLFGVMVVTWTTPISEIAPAVAVFAGPLRKLRFPVDEWAVAIALCVRGLPLLIEEIGIQRASRRLRPRDISRYRETRESPIIDIITATMAVAMRRADELGEAITARGGTGQLAAYPSRPGRIDIIAAVVVAAVCGLSVGSWLVF